MTWQRKLEKKGEKRREQTGDKKENGIKEDRDRKMKGGKKAKGGEKKRERVERKVKNHLPLRF